MPVVAVRTLEGRGLVQERGELPREVDQHPGLGGQLDRGGAKDSRITGEEAGWGREAYLSFIHKLIYFIIDFRATEFLSLTTLSFDTSKSLLITDSQVLSFVHNKRNIVLVDLN